MKTFLVFALLALVLAGCNSMPPVDSVAKQYVHQYPERTIVKVEAVDEHEMEGSEASYRIYYTIAGDPTTQMDTWRYRKVAEGWAPAP
jgi:hypothetical protein